MKKQRPPKRHTIVKPEPDSVLKVGRMRKISHRYFELQRLRELVRGELIAGQSSNLKRSSVQ